MKKYRITAHHIVFFIFIVANIGGCLTPIGDPPLFLGYLKGIPFWWVAEHCWPMWAAGVGLMLAMFYLIDRANYMRAPKQVRQKLAEPHDVWRFEGLSNLFFLAIILGAVFLNHPPMVREGLMVAAALGSYFTTRKSVHESNHFNFHPIQEVAILFVGIFATMMPALDWLQLNAGKLVNPSPSLFFWGTGSLSSVLDNAPTYLSFLSASFGMFVDQDIVQQTHRVLQSQPIDFGSLAGAHAEQIQQTVLALQKYHPAEVASGTVTLDNIAVAYLLGNSQLNNYILAISVGAVFFGANTYIGNGPNFMVKAIADQQKVHTPTFLGFVFKYSLLCMLPMLLIVWWIFFRG
jgi:Na+/H+ antiporter NhaD/arsenite permease-like protein